MGGPVVPSLAAQLRRICSGPRLRANDSSVCLGWKGSRRCCAVAWLASIFLRPRLEVCKSLGSSASGTRARVYRELLAALQTQCGQLTCSLRCEPVPEPQAGSCRTEPRGDPWWPRAPAGAVWSGSAGAVRRQNLPPRHCFRLWTDPDVQMLPWANQEATVLARLFGAGWDACAGGRQDRWLKR